ncbi:MAG: lycopene cyclase domain-containing protein [Candidatus Omnitrophica bacterium]|nr:lycopene cyclase domain-containing protein [Candidatus Omnitrophota bacterium]
MSDYILILLLSLSVPLLCSFWPGLKFYRHIRALFLSMGLVLIIFGGWDVFATYRGHWYFDPEGVWSIRIINLPLEEVLFFFVITFCCIFTWEVVKYFKGLLR